ncbi:CDP-alcohol phosphatidyltransferase family protein [Halothermothrix orenii]|uniref:Phosphatidylglycerophosphate synthase n=1 Tax=Halothermothrix orenii (strain H 168 / OCM 544 / DSM 9562) TaxID=373903 RepID=B8CX01_HALOH|nr:CDP-alcohol phosphatidyltransferase family protein [Halothermothrix orenii]ACL69820.1 CDP-diacylglycerol--glycerol-3-phosphate 3-phosphatidyltransferase [Halothermothrix orenii H 168]
MNILPNLLTLVRIVLIPVYINYFISGDYITAAVIFSISGLSDFFDGFLARRYNVTSKLGRILDPLADKLTIISILFLLVTVDIIPELAAIVILTREILVLLGSGIAYVLGIDMINPSILGKISVFLLYVTLAGKLFDIKYIDIILIYIVIPLNVISAIGYTITAVKKVRA